MTRDAGGFLAVNRIRFNSARLGSAPLLAGLLARRRVDARSARLAANSSPCVVAFTRRRDIAP